MTADSLLEKVRNGGKLSFGEQFLLPLLLSLPAMLSQLSTIVMEYVDASMVGSLGANDSASIGLVSTSTWLFGGICMAINSGFTVQVAQLIGAKQEEKARAVMKQGFVVSILFCLILVAVGLSVGNALPVWLGGGEEIRVNASAYFLIYICSLPFIQLNSLSSGMLQSSGNMKVPGALNVLVCVLNVFFNALFIFPTGEREFFGWKFSMTGLGMGVSGAALGTLLADVCVCVALLAALFFGSRKLKLRRGEKFRFSKETVGKAFRISLPIGLEQVATCGAYVMATKIVAPLGNIAIAANSFAVTAESLCYMPGYGIGQAATTLVGQGVGAGNKRLTRKLAYVSVALGVVFMSVTGGLMFAFAPQMIGLLSPDESIRQLGAAVLRIEAFAEPLYAAAIVSSGALRGAGDTLVPGCMNFLSMWAVRLPMAAILAPKIGLEGVWIAMCAELCVRGVILLIRLGGKRWSDKAFPAGKGEEEKTFRQAVGTEGEQERDNGKRGEE